MWGQKNGRSSEFQSQWTTHLVGSSQRCGIEHDQFPSKRSNKHNPQVSTLSGVRTSIFSGIGQFILARFIQAYKLRAIGKEVVARLHFSPLHTQFFITFNGNLVENFLGQTSSFEGFMKGGYWDSNVVLNAKPEDKLIKVKIWFVLVERVYCSKNSLSENSFGALDGLLTEPYWSKVDCHQ